MRKNLRIEKERLKTWADWLIHNNRLHHMGIGPWYKFEDKGDYIEEQLYYFTHATHVLPEVFKDDWLYDDKKNPYYKEDPIQVPISSILTYFGLTYQHFEMLLIPGFQNVEFGLKTLSPKATPVDIGMNILSFIETMEKMEKEEE